MAAHVQQPAPQFSCEAVVNGEFKDVALSDYKGKYVVLFFYPLDFTFVCPTEILRVQRPRRRVPQDRVRDRVRRWTASTPPRCLDQHAAQKAASGVTIPLLADLKKEIARDYGVLPDGVAARGSS
jgi:alkyl hydroperoxide reductase subunit AhpC